MTFHYCISNSVCLQPPLPAHCQHYSTCVANATTKLQQCTQQLMSALRDPFVGLTKCANFEAASRDSALMQQLLPSSAVGYLCAANVFIEQGRQHDAVDICNVGLSVVDKSDPEYHQLKKVKAVAKQRGLQRVDFIKQLPVDIVATVLAPLIIQEKPLDAMIPCSYLNVSHVWRDRMLEASGGALRFIIASDLQEEDTYHQLNTLSQYARSLRITRCSRGQWIRDIFRHTNLCSLRELRIDAFVGYEYTTLRLALAHVSSTLTHLSISVPNGYLPPVPSLLVICRHLISLQVFEAYDIDLRSLPRATLFPNLTMLRLDCTVGQISYDKVLAMLHRFPSLKHLALNPCPDPRSMSVIQHHCPLLKSLELGICIVGANLPRDESDDNNSSDDMIGLQRLYLCGTQETRYAWKDVHDFINQHHNTLERIELNVTLLKQDDEDDDDPITRVSFPCLKKLFLHHMSQSDPCFGWWLSASAPCLEEFHLTANVILSNPAILDTTPPKLKMLRMRLDTTYSWDRHHADITDYLWRLDQKVCPLETLEIHANGDTYQMTMEAVARLDHLKHFIFGISQDMHCLGPYLKKLAEGCQHLTRLEIKCNTNVVPPPMHPYSLACLLRLPRLKQLVLPVDHDTAADFWEPLLLFPQLQCLALYPEQHALVSLDRQSFKKERPNLRIVLLKQFESFSSSAGSL